MAEAGWRRTSDQRHASRRTLLRATAAAAFVPTLAPFLVACSGSASTAPDPEDSVQPDVSPSPPAASGDPAGQRVLLAFCSRAGENYSYGGRTNLQVGNTDVAAQMISGLIACDVHRIEAAEAYPNAYDATVARNTTEQDEDARPALAQDLPDVSGYDVVLLGSPIWNVRPPMLMSTFTEGLDLAGKRVLPFVTYAISGLGSTQRVYAETCRGAELGEGLAVRGEEVADARPAVQEWLRGAGLLSA